MDVSCAFLATWMPGLLLEYMSQDMQDKLPQKMESLKIYPPIIKKLTLPETKCFTLGQDLYNKAACIFSDFVLKGKERNKEDQGGVDVKYVKHKATSTSKLVSFIWNF